MKRALSAALALIMAAALAGCADKAPSGSPDTVKGELPDIMASILDGVDGLPTVGDIAIDETNFEFFLFIPYIEGSEALASEAMMSSVAHSAVLLRVPEGTDAEKTAEDIRAKANPTKWICVSAEKTEVSVRGDLILLVMSFEDAAKTITANFMAL